MIDNILGQESLGQESNNLPGIKQQTQEVICRVFFLRHGQSEDEAKNSSLPQDPETPLSPLGIEQIKTAAGRFQELGLNDENTIVIYAEGTQRIRSSKEILQQYHNVATFKENTLLETTLKKYNPETNEVEDDKSHMQGVADQFKNIVDLVDGEILKSFQDKDGKYHEKKNIILLGHKSSEAFPQLANERKESTILHGLRIKPGETFEMDIDSTNTLINYEQHKEILHLTSENYKGILEILKQEEEIKGYIQQFSNHVIQLFELQNIINEYFRKNSELYELYISGLHIFCISNLLKLGEYYVSTKYLDEKYKDKGPIEREEIFNKSNLLKLGTDNIIINYLDRKWKDIGYIKKREIFNLIKKDKNIIENFFNLFFKEKNESSEYNEFKTYIRQETTKLGDDYMLLMNYYENIYPLVQEVESKSLDMRIRRGEDIKIDFHFDRNNYLNSLLCNSTRNYLNDWFFKKTKDYRDGDDTIAVTTSIFKENNGIIYIEASSGSGKSLLLAHINKTLKNKKFIMKADKYVLDDKRVFPIYINLSGAKNVDNIIQNIENIKKNYEKYNSIFHCYLSPCTMYFFDSLDESDFSDQDKERFLKVVSEFNGKVIITGRIGSIPEKTIGSEKFKDKIEKITLKELSDEYIDQQAKNYFGNDSHGYSIFNTSIHGISGIQPIISNPLTLTMIFNLIDYKGTIQFGSLSLLYREIATMRLISENEKKQESRKTFIKRESKIEENDETNKIIQKRMDFLSELAYANIFEGINIDDTLFKRIQEKYTGIIPNEDCLNLLFKKNNNQEYDFIHQNFKEFFAIKEFFRILSKKQGKEAEKYLDHTISENLIRIDYGTLNFLIDNDSLKFNGNGGSVIREMLIAQLLSKAYTGSRHIRTKIIYILYRLDPTILKKLPLLMGDFDNDIVEQLIYNILSINRRGYTDYIKYVVEKTGKKKALLIKVLGRIGGKENIEFIKSFKDDKDIFVIAQMIVTLGEIGGETDIELIKSFKDDKKNSSRKAGLANTIDNNPGLTILVLFLSLPIIKVVYPILEILYIVFKNREDRSIFNKKNEAVLYDNDIISYDQIKKVLINVVGKIGGKENIEFIKSFKDDKNGDIRREMIDVLGKIGGKENIEFIKSFKDDKSYEVQAQIINTLGSLGGEENIEYIKLFKNSEYIWIKLLVIKTLGAIGGESNIEFIKSFKNNKEPEIRTKLIETLYVIGGENNIEFIKSFRNDKKPEIRIKLIETLGLIGGEDNIEFIKSFKNDKDNGVIKAVINAPGIIWGEEDIEFIKSLKNSNDLGIYQMMIRILYDIGGEKNNDFIKSLKRNRIRQRDKIAIIEIIEQIGGKGGIDRIITSFKNDKDNKIREKIIYILGKRGGEENIEIIKSFKNDKSEKVRYLMIKILWKMGGEDNIEFIKSLKDDEAIGIRRKIIEILSKVGGEDNIKFIKSFKDDKNYAVRLDLISTLGKLGGEKNIEFIKSFKDDKNFAIKERIIEIVGAFGGKENIDYIENLNKTRNFIEKITKQIWEAKIAFKSILLIPNKEATDKNSIELFYSFKREKEKRIRERFIALLGRRGREEDIEFIKSLKDNKNYDVKIGIIKALGKIGREEKKPREEEIKFIKSFRDDEDYRVRIQVIKTLGEIGGEDNIEFIKYFENDKNIKVKEAMIEILGKIGGEENIEFISPHKKRYNKF